MVKIGSSIPSPNTNETLTILTFLQRLHLMHSAQHILLPNCPGMPDALYATVHMEPTHSILILHYVVTYVTSTELVRGSKSGGVYSHNK